MAHQSIAPKNYENRRGLMLVLSSPSGAGKSTLSRMLMQDEGHDVVMSVSATTREPRPGEREGQDYYFVSHDRFKAMIDGNEMLEHAVVFDHRYGTPRGPVMAALASGKDMLFDIDWQGTQQLAESAGDDLVRIFILPPSVSELESRLRKRAQDSEKTVQKRMQQAESEISHWAEYDYVLVNDDLDETYAKLRSILAAERLRRKRKPDLSEFVRGLMAERHGS